MIKVFVWLPAGYNPSLDELFSQIFNKENLENLIDKTDSPFENPFVQTKRILEQDDETILKRIFGMNNPIPIVREAMRQEINRVCGHVSLSIKLKDGREQYLSFWPTKEDVKKVVFRIKGKFLDNYEEDKKGMGREADEVIEISNLNEDIVYQYICECKKRHEEKNYEYNLFVQNCSTIAISALYKGTPRSLSTKFQDFWSRCKESLEAAGVYSWTLIGLYSILYREQIIGSVNINVGNIQNLFVGGESSIGIKMIKKHFSSTKSVFSIFEIGLQTPKSVLEYAYHLKELK
jgi:hypothetical protein